jgi:pimeloyl-ACP methyl ester carboxylesterase
MEEIKNWVLIRGLARDARHWGDFVARFAAGMNVAVDRIVTLDLPGFGSNSNVDAAMSVADMAEDIRSQWISKKGKVDGAWGCLAMSLGGMCEIEWARLFPADLSALVAINASASDLSNLWHRFSFRQLPRALRITLTGDRKQRETEIYHLTSNGSEAEIKAEEWKDYAPAQKDFLNAGLRQLMAAARYKSPTVLEVPLLVLTSKADGFVDFRCSEALAEKYRAPLRVHLTAGHDLCMDDPDWVIQQTKLWVSPRKLS